MKFEKIGSLIGLAALTLTLANCGRVTSNGANTEATAQETAVKWHEALVKNTSEVRGVSAAKAPQLSQAEIEERVLHVVNYLEKAQAARTAVTTQQSWMGRYGGQNKYQAGTVSATGGYYQVRTRYNPNVISDGGTATGSGLVSYNGPSGAGAAGVHVGILGVCAGAAAGSKASLTGNGCGGCVTWTGQAYGGCF